jgi:glutaredoxin
MNPSDVNRPHHLCPAARLRALAIVAVAIAMPAQALYKIVGPDGKVTYTDRPPSASEGRVTPLSATGNVAEANPAELPLELRQAAARYPATLYVVADCSPCDSARSLLRQRGIPHAERIVVTEEDAEAVQRLAGTRDVPTLTLGTQALRGFSAETWNAYLDSAGYPRESRLPAGYQHPAATPVTQRADPAPAPAPPSAPRVARPAPTSPSGIRF